MPTDDRDRWWSDSEYGTTKWRRAIETADVGNGGVLIGRKIYVYIIDKMYCTTPVATKIWKIFEPTCMTGRPNLLSTIHGSD